MKTKTERASASEVRGVLDECKERWKWSSSDIISLLRGGGSSGKGSDFERETCKTLSLWWTDGLRDDVFWRCSGSGARATVRSRVGVNTAGQYGDVAATDPIGALLIKAFTIELKRGYSEYTFQDLVDRASKSGEQEWERFFAQAVENSERAGSYSWLLITRRDRRQALVWMPYYCVAELRKEGVFSNRRPSPFVRMCVVIRSLGEETLDVCGMVLEDWLSEVCPEHVGWLAKRVWKA